MSFKFGFTSELGRIAAQFTVAAVGHVVKRFSENKSDYKRRYNTASEGRQYRAAYMHRLPDVDDMHLFDDIFDSVIGIKDARRKMDLKHSEVIDMLDERYPEWELELESMIENKNEGE